MKKIISVFIALLIFQTNLSVFAQNRFGDVPDSNNEYSHAINSLAERNIISGYNDGMFHPQNNITRAEFATILCKHKYGNYNIETTNKNYFSDVRSDHWANAYINKMFQDGIIYGIGNGQFLPEDNLTFEQALMIIVRYAGKDHLDTANSYNHTIGYLVAASEMGALNGFEYSWSDPRITPWSGIDENGNLMIYSKDINGQVEKLPTLDDLTPAFMKSVITREQVALLLYNIIDQI